MHRILEKLVRESVPVLFAAIMGTGAISILFHAFPYGTGSQPMLILSLIFFFLNLFLFLVFSIASFMRYYMYPGDFVALLKHPVQSMYIGCFPMGAATLIIIGTTVIHEEYHFGGKGFLYFLWVTWWINIVLSALCCWGGVQIMAARQTHSLEAMTSVWLLPVVTLIVAASTGGVLAQALEKYSIHHSLITVTVAMVSDTIGLSLALMMLVIYLLRIIVYGLPNGITIMSAFLPLGPTAQAGYGVIVFGQCLKSIIPVPFGHSDFLQSGMTGEIINVVCICLAVVLWSLASMWILYAFIGIFETVRKARFPFMLPIWGIVFPNGVYANLTIQLSFVFNSRFFRIYGAICAIWTLLLWLYVVSQSLVLLNALIFTKTSPDAEKHIVAATTAKEEALYGGRSTSTSTSATNLP